MNNKRTRNRFRLQAVILSLLLIVTAVAGCGYMPPSKGADTMNQPGKESTQKLAAIAAKDIPTALLDGKYDQLYAQFGDSLKGAVTLNNFKSMAKDFLSDIKGFQLTSTFKLNGYESYVWDDSSGQKGLTAIVDKNGIIEGIQIMPHSPHPVTDQAYSKTIVDFPFRDQWFVFWGGKNIMVNYHYEYESYRYAYDFVKEKNGYSYEGDPTKNESYFAFGQEIVAPAAGVVVEAVDGIADNTPGGEMNTKQPSGNVVTIKHPNGEFSSIAHLMKGSVQVKVGDSVTAGQLLGKCGNSGNSSEPHVHYQMSPPSDNGKHSTTIPITFKDGSKPIRGELAGKKDN
ncbi:M23 family metallopeptidase [Paenibacillus sp. N1-5-1-14]|uniref:M23 family metallopeptidase n=1 Tax=Paenibacillus radicibacter TaxID=2972488 RepID=UPI0021590BA0|nr:M23 family metallopeptidase [Paenibacillus radicibacter]MCR8642769.1 M23 family metallopeptidase [Paenibacillus radicibacter]